MKNEILYLSICAGLLASCNSNETQQKPNVLFISIDDLNDWTGFLAGHPDALTPNLDKLASNSMVFSSAYCPSPACNPSRTSIMTGIRPSTSGIYLNNQPWRESPVLQDIQTIPQLFRDHGYSVMGSGKIFHDPFADPASWDEFWPSLQRQRPDDPIPEGMPLNGLPDAGQFDWGPIDYPKEEFGDWQVADWVIEQINKDHQKPFFLACGFFRPHLPWHVPQEYFDKFPLDEISLPVVYENDVDDIPEAGRRLIRFRDHERVIEHGQWKHAVQGYLASINFMDECLGRVIEALENSKHWDNTIIVLWSDHGWNLGEKNHWRKFALWENTTRSVFMIRTPENKKNGSVCSIPVNLLDIYPTLLELCELPAKSSNEGVSLVPLLESPDMDWGTASISTHRQNQHAIRLHNWRYIRYEDGSEELYNHDNDPREWTNLASFPQYANVKEEMKRHLPVINVDPVPFER